MIYATIKVTIKSDEEVPIEIHTWTPAFHTQSILSATYPRETVERMVDKGLLILKEKLVSDLIRLLK